MFVLLQALLKQKVANPKKLDWSGIILFDDEFPPVGFFPAQFKQVEPGFHVLPHQDDLAIPDMVDLPDLLSAHVVNGQLLCCLTGIGARINSD